MNDIALLQARLHEANAQLEQANSDCVKQGEQLASLARGKEETVAKVRNMERKNAAMKRRLASLEGRQIKLPKPGPRLKAFEDLTHRQQKVASKNLQAQLNQTSEERRIHPARLSAYLTYR